MIVAYATVDKEDAPLVNKFRWSLGSRGEAKTSFVTNNGSIITLRMHRLIMGAPRDVEIDHRDHILLHNRKANLRFATSADNAHNYSKPKHYRGRPTSSIYKGVSWRPRIKKWQARIGVDYKEIHLGFFNSEIEAAERYNEAAKEYFGEFAWLNKV